MLHKLTKLHGFHIVATDGQIGHVDDFLIDEGWNLSHLVVDTSNWLGGKSVLISPSAVVAVDSPHKEIRVKLTREEIAKSPPLDTANIELIETLPPAVI